MKRISLFVVFLTCVALSSSAQNPTGPPPQDASGPPAANAGGKVVIAKIGFKGNVAFSDAVLLKAVRLRVGQPMSPDLVKRAVDRLVTYYRAHDANLSVWPNIDPHGGHAVVQFVIDEHGTQGDAGAFPHGAGH